MYPSDDCKNISTCNEACPSGNKQTRAIYNNLFLFYLCDTEVNYYIIYV